MAVEEFIWRYYVAPIVYDTGYNVVNTATWAVLLLVTAFFVYKLFKRWGVEVDERFLLGLTPYVLAGVLLRVAEDAELVPAPHRYFLVSPLIWLELLAATLLVLAACVGVAAGKAAGRKLAERKFGWAGVAVFVGALVFFVLCGGGRSWRICLWAPLLVFSLAVAAHALVWAAAKALRLEFLTGAGSYVLFSHLLDAASSYVGIKFLGYRSKHVLESMLCGLSTEAVALMFPLKVLVIAALLYLLPSLEDGELRGVILAAAFVLGLGPALRNTLRMSICV
ncbi:MAG: DUF63 family protein [Candidatus Alkanophagales archaeon]